MFTVLGRGSVLRYTLRPGQHPTAKGMLTLPCLGLLPAPTSLCWRSSIGHYSHLPIAHRWVWGLLGVLGGFFLFFSDNLQVNDTSTEKPGEWIEREKQAHLCNRWGKRAQGRSAAQQGIQSMTDLIKRDPDLPSSPLCCQRHTKHGRSPSQCPGWWRGLSDVSRKLSRRFSLAFWSLNCCEVPQFQPCPAPVGISKRVCFKEDGRSQCFHEECGHFLF